MGRFAIEVVAIGGHGCERQTDGDREVWGCGLQSCPDCATRQFVRRLKEEQHCNVEVAVITHWPDDNVLTLRATMKTGSVRDDLLTKKRDGSFSSASPFYRQ